MDVTTLVGILQYAAEPLPVREYPVGQAVVGPDAIQVVPDHDAQLIELKQVPLVLRIWPWVGQAGASDTATHEPL